MICPFCNKPARWVENKEIYNGKNYGKSYMAWWCKPCDAYVGCHNNTKKPLGTLADYKTRQYRKMAHAIFDPLWRNTFKRRSNKRLNRDAVYSQISNKFGYRVHIGESNVEQCKNIIQWCEKRKEK